MSHPGLLNFKGLREKIPEALFFFLQAENTLIQGCHYF
jgi:hypothetical protein